jgi:hypothetical protein
MTAFHHEILASLVAVGLAAGCPVPACAALGGDAASVAADAAALHGAATITPLPAYDIHQIVAADGSRVREFQDRAGIVFALSWSGPAMPDLKVLLGGHYAAYGEALAGMARRGLRRSVRVATPDLVVEAGGHMRAFSGRAYLPNRIPPGTPASDLR